jgi:hypothetical protein
MRGSEFESQVPGVIDELDDFLIFLGLEEDAAVGHLHGLERQIGYAGPGKDQIARLPPPRNSPQLYHGEIRTLAGNLRFARERGSGYGACSLAGPMPNTTRFLASSV